MERGSWCRILHMQPAYASLVAQGYWVYLNALDETVCHDVVAKQVQIRILRFEYDH